MKGWQRRRRAAKSATRFAKWIARTAKQTRSDTAAQNSSRSGFHILESRVFRIGNRIDRAASTGRVELPAAPDRDEERRRLQRRLANLPEFFEEKARKAAAACHASQDDQRGLCDRLSAGIRCGVLSGQSGRNIEVVLGMDFGTSSTKIVARFPYEAGSPAFAVPVLPFARAESHPYLWASRLWLAPDGKFSLAPEAPGHAFCAIKAGLMVKPPRTIPVDTSFSRNVTAEVVASAFLALQIRQAKGWLATDRGHVSASRPYPLILQFSLSGSIARRSCSTRELSALRRGGADRSQ
jgi:hypothetical protein